MEEKIVLYKGSAGGWGALASTSKHLIKSENALKNIGALLRTNQHKGFDCPGCAWGDQVSHNKKISFCENGAKAVNWEATSKTVDARFFAENSVSYLDTKDDHFLEYQGRLVEPLRYNAKTDHYEPITWENAFSLVAEHLHNLDSPNEAEFYTSGRASNEVAFLYQLFVRMYGTNNFPDCSNMCHEASGVALKQSIGIGKGSVTIEDFSHADTIFVFGQNPGTNHPRMLDTLSKAARNGSNIISFNNLRERGLERFTDPQRPLEMLTNGYTKISKHYYKPKLGGDMALVRGITKAFLILDEEARAAGKKSLLDHDFLNEHTYGLEAYQALVKRTTWEHVEKQSGISKEDMFAIAQSYAESKNAIFTWAMGITQHTHSVATIQEIVNLLLLRGNMGRQGAGACPVRGHSNVQGDRTMGINEKAPKEFLAKLEEVFGINVPKEHGHNAVQAVNAMLRGDSKVFIALGGNFAAAMPDTEKTRQALRNCKLTVNIATKLNRSHLTPGKDSLIFPCLGRTDIDETSMGEQKITVEDSMSMVHSSEGLLKPPSKLLKSEVSLIAHIAHNTLGSDVVDWLGLAEDNVKIRDLIEKCVPGFENFNERLKTPGGFHLYHSAANREWNTPNKRANIMANELPKKLIADEIANTQDVKSPIFTLQTLRSHDQYNTTIYGYNDRYRGVKGLRKVIFMNPEDMKSLNLQQEQEVTITSYWHDGSTRSVHGFKVIEYDIPKGNMASYYPETNPLVHLDSFGEYSFTPTSKSIAISIHP